VAKATGPFFVLEDALLLKFYLFFLPLNAPFFFFFSRVELLLFPNEITSSAKTALVPMNQNPWVIRATPILIKLKLISLGTA